MAVFQFTAFPPLASVAHAAIGLAWKWREESLRARVRACETAPLLLASEKRRKLFANNRSIETAIKYTNDH